MEKIKAEILIPTVQYGNVRFFLEDTAENVLMEAKRLNKLYLGGFGLEPKEWNKCLDKYLADGSMEPSVHEQMSDEQRWLVHEIDKSVSRVNYKNPKGNQHHSLT